MVHLIQEYARHNGHADLIREGIDGAVGVSDTVARQTVKTPSSRLSSPDRPSSSRAATRARSTSSALSSASLLTDVSVSVTVPAPSAADATLRVSSPVVAVCSSTALAIVVWWSLIARTTSAIWAIA